MTVLGDDTEVTVTSSANSVSQTDSGHSALEHSAHLQHQSLSNLRRKLPDEIMLLICNSTRSLGQHDLDFLRLHVWELALGRSGRSCSQTIPEALAKFWRAAGSKVLAFGYMVRKLRSIAFQRCI